MKEENDYEYVIDVGEYMDYWKKITNQLNHIKTLSILVDNLLDRVTILESKLDEISHKEAKKDNDEQISTAMKEGFKKLHGYSYEYAFLKAILKEAKEKEASSGLTFSEAIKYPKFKRPHFDSWCFFKDFYNDGNMKLATRLGTCDISITLSQESYEANDWEVSE